MIPGLIDTSWTLRMSLNPQICHQFFPVHCYLRVRLKSDNEMHLCVFPVYVVFIHSIISYIVTCLINLNALYPNSTLVFIKH